jgi:hypothetical protein
MLNPDGNRKRNSMNVKEFARRAGISPHTVRYYEKVDLPRDGLPLFSAVPSAALPGPNSADLGQGGSV